MIVLAQDSEKISASTTQIIKSVAERLLSVLDGDATVTYNFAFAMYAEQLNISSFGNKATTLSYMNGLFSKTKQQRNNGDKNQNVFLEEPYGSFRVAQLTTKR